MYKNIVFSLSLFLCSITHAESPTQKSVLKLMEVMQSEKMMAQMPSLIKPMINKAIEQADVERKTPLTKEQKQQLTQFTQDITTMMLDEFKWDNIKIDFAKIYMETFTQQEIDGMIAFYQSPVGQSTLEKMPILMTKSMQLSMNRSKALMPKIKNKLEEILKKNNLDN